MISTSFSTAMDLPFLWDEAPTASSFTRISCLVVAVGEGNTSFLPLKLVALVEGTSTGLGSGIGEVSLSEDYEGPPPS